MGSSVFFPVLVQQQTGSSQPWIDGDAEVLALLAIFL
jgi:hypothetical protein